MPSVANLVRSDGDPKILEAGPSSVYPEDRLAKSLGWFSVGLGLVELVAAQRLTRTLGLEGFEPLVRAFGAREIASGVATLSTEKSTGLQSRLVGDVLDLTLLGQGLSRSNPNRSNVKWAMLAVAGVTVLDAFAAYSVSARKSRSKAPRSFADRSGFPKGRIKQGKNESSQQKIVGRA